MKRKVYRVKVRKSLTVRYLNIIFMPNMLFQFHREIREKFMVFPLETFVFGEKFLKIFEENENGRSERMNYGYREQKLTELGVNDKSFE